MNEDTQGALILLDDVEQSIRHAIKKINRDGALETLCEDYGAYLESWLIDIQSAMKKLAGNL